MFKFNDLSIISSEFLKIKLYFIIKIRLIEGKYYIFTKLENYKIRH